MPIPRTEILEMEVVFEYDSEAEDGRCPVSVIRASVLGRDIEIDTALMARLEGHLSGLTWCREREAVTA